MPTLASETGRIHFHKIISLLGAVLAFAGMTACDSFLEPQLQADLQVNTSSVHFTALSDSRQLTATVLNAIGDPIAEPDLQWSSTDPAIAAVSGAGVVTSRATGQAQVTVKARCCDVSKKVEVTIEQVPTVLLVTPDQAEMDVGDTLRIDARAEDANGNAIQGLTFTTQDGTVAAVSDDGVVSAKGEGTTAVEVSVGAVRAQADVKVRGKTNTEVSEIRASVDSYQFKALGDVLDASADALDASGNVVHGIAFDWSSSNASVATVDKNGRITAVADGSATITVSAPCCGKSDQIAITVSPPPATSLVLDPGEVSVDVGQTVQLSVKDNQGHPVGGATFSSSNAAAATVGSDGKVKGVGAGSATITAKAGTLSGKASVNVVATTPPPPTVDVARVQVSKAALAFTALGDTARLSATALDGSGGTVSEVSFGWSSSNASVVTVDSMGLLTARSVGTASVVVAALCCSAADTVAVTVHQVAATITLSPTVSSLAVGEAVQLATVVQDANGNTMTATPTWASSNPAVAMIMDAGLVRGVAAGSAIVRGSFSGLSASATIDVHESQAPTGLIVTDGFENADYFGAPSGFSWVSGLANHRSTVQPETGSYALDRSYPASTLPGGNANNEANFNLRGHYSELWIERHIYIGANYRHITPPDGHNNNKFFALWGREYGGDNRAKLVIEFRPDNTSGMETGDSKFRFLANPSGGPSSYNLGTSNVGGTATYVSPGIASSGTALLRGQYTTFRLHVKVGSGPGEGVIQAWIGSALIFDQSGLNLYPEGGTDTPAPYFEAGYLWGAANSGFEEATQIFEDNFKVYTADPGW